MDKEYTDVEPVEIKDYGYGNLVKDITALKIVCESQTEAIKVLKDEIMQLIKESEMHKNFIKSLFVQTATLTTTALPNFSVEVWNKLCQGTKNLGVFDKLYDEVEGETK